MNYYIPLIAALFLLGFNLHQAIAYCTDSRGQQPLSDQARYDFYRLYRVDLTTNQQVRIFQMLEEHSDSCMFFGHARHPKQKLIVLVAAHKIADFVDILKTYKISYRVLSYNFQHKINNNYWEVMPRGTDPNAFDWIHFFHLETIYAWMEMMAKKYPNKVTLLDIGQSTQGIAIKGVRIGTKKQNKAIFIESGIHPREWIATTTATYIINELLTSLDQDTHALVEKYNWIIFPVVNPDGYKYTFEGDRMWRKNRQSFGGVCRGVDLNRNFGCFWNSTCSTANPCHYDYPGPCASSEMETRRLVKYLTENVQREHIRTYISLHAYSQMIMFPYSHAPERVENYDDLKSMSIKASETIRKLSGRKYVTGSAYETIYPSSGNSKDFAYEELNIPLTFTFELRGPPECEFLFIIPSEEIIPTGKEIFAAIATIIYEAEAKGYYSDGKVVAKAQS